MPATPETIWQVPAYLPYLQPALTDQAIAESEAKIGHRLPNAYLEILRKQNGGYIRYKLPEGVQDTIAGIGPHFPTLTSFEKNQSPDFLSYSLEGLVGFDGDGHWFLCFDYRANADDPAVTYIDVECDSQEKIADSFSDYLRLLRLETDNRFVIDCANDIEGLKQRLTKALKLKFDTQDEYDHGYILHRAPIGSRSDPSWLWLSSNTVPRGFVRTDDERYEELREIMPGTAKRYPEFSESSCIIEVSDKKAARKFATGCRDAGIDILVMGETLKDG